MVVDRETLGLPAERKYADLGACNVVASDQLEAEVVPSVVEIHSDGRSELNGYMPSAASSSWVDV